MRPIDLQQVISDMRSQLAPVVMCQAGYVFVNLEKLPAHEALQAQIHDRVESGVIRPLTHLNDDDVAVFYAAERPVPPERRRRQQQQAMFQLNTL